MDGPSFQWWRGHRVLMCFICSCSDVASNSITTIPKGTFPLGLEQLYLDRNLLTEIPPDVAEMPRLINLYVHTSVQGRT
jgi:hypothetical protein